MLDFLSINITELSHYFFDANKRLYVVYLLSALVLAVPAYFSFFTRFSPLTFLGFVFPKAVYNHQSARHDYALLIINKLIKSALFPLMVISMAPVAIAVSSAIEAVFGYMQPLVLSTTVIVTIFTALLFIFDDFSRFLFTLLVA
jgi:sterol desaturase/sphingolipid hydroxylase (fatty acid hydroxylase superfamily)